MSERCEHGMEKIWRYDHLKGEDKLICPGLQKKDNKKKDKKEDKQEKEETVEKECPRCGGEGEFLSYDDIHTCKRCFGTGTIKEVIE